ncbi:MAG TPA: DsrE family protein [Gammaproteobacteria bacterium]|nr:DsrE family protein [Gammaproteobacteria bacterium]
MSAKEKFSDEFINAFLDGQLDADERSRLLDEVRRDPALSGRVCELQKVREMVQLAYHNVAVPQRYRQPAPVFSTRYAKALAASMLLALGVLVGWFTNAAVDQPNSLLEMARTVQTPPGAHGKVWHVMLHVSTADPVRLNTLLDETDHLLRYSAHSTQKVRVEVLTNGNGLELLSADNSPYASRIRQMQREYGNLTFLACHKALQRLKHDKGINLDLVKGAKVVPSAMGEIIKRQREGWTYIHI